MIGLLDLGGRGLARAALDHTDEAVAVLPNLDVALASLAAGEYSALILETDGLDPRARQLLVAAAGRTLPTLVVARDRTVSTAVEALRGGATDYLCSPFQYESLQRALGRLLDASSTRKEVPGDDDPFVTTNQEMRAARAAPSSGVAAAKSGSRHGELRRSTVRLARE
jgi:DNA-binding NtrC family response regulator